MILGRFGWTVTYEEIRDGRQKRSRDETRETSKCWVEEVQNEKEAIIYGTYKTEKSQLGKIVYPLGTASLLQAVLVIAS